MIACWAGDAGRSSSSTAPPPTAPTTAPPKAPDKVPARQPSRFDWITAFFGFQHGEDQAKRRWEALWEGIANGEDVEIVDQDALLACERWRRAAQGERHGGWYKFRHAHWERLTRSIRSGIPCELRSAVWYVCCGAVNMKRESGRSYNDFVEEGLNLTGTEAARVIEADIPRSGVEEHRWESLQNVLLAFAAKNPAIGYCQSMNFIAATLLLYDSEEQAFWMLCSLIEDLLPAGYYTENMKGLRVDLKVLDSLIEKYMPDLHRHLASELIDLTPITMNWFLCLFVNTLPNERSHRVLDCLLHEGSKVLFRTALGVLRVKEQELLRAPGVVEAYCILRVPFGSDSDSSLQMVDTVAASAEDDLMDTIHGSWLRGLSFDDLLRLRKEHSATIQAEDEEIERRRLEVKAKSEATENAQATSEVHESKAQKMRRSSRVVLDMTSEVARKSLHHFGFRGRVRNSMKDASKWLAQVSKVSGHGIQEETEEDWLEQRTSTVEEQQTDTKKNFPSATKLFSSMQVTEESLEQLRSWLPDTPDNIEASAPPLNTESIDLALPCVSCVSKTFLNNKISSVRLPFVIMALFETADFQALSKDLKVPIPPYVLDSIAQKKMVKVLDLVAEAKRSNFVVGENILAVQRLEGFCKDFQMLHASTIQRPEQFKAFVEDRVLAGWEDKLHADHILSNFGFKEEVSVKLRQATIGSAEHEQIAFEQHALPWLAKALRGYGPAASLVDVLNLIYAVMGHDQPLGVSEQDAIKVVMEFRTRLQKLDFDGLWIPTHISHNADCDGALCWLLLEHIHRKMKTILHVLIQLPSEGCDHVEAIEDFLQSRSRYVKVFQDKNSSNGEAVVTTWRHLLPERL